MPLGQLQNLFNFPNKGNFTGADPLANQPQMSPIEGLLGALSTALMGPLAPLGAADWATKVNNENNPKMQGIQYGMVPTAKNLDKFNDIKAKFMQALSGSPNEREALSFLQTRYPRVYHTPVDVAPLANQNAYGSTKFMRGPDGKIYSGVTYDPSEHKGVEDLVNTVGHELRHSVDFERAPSSAYYQEMFKGPYYKQPGEIRARLSGNTAQKAYQDYQKVLQGQEPTNNLYDKAMRILSMFKP